jgi:3-oxoacyl-[acyl-carrier protein] reductase
MPVAVITGASRGIGKQLSMDLAEAGYDIVATARSSADSPNPQNLPGTIDETAELVRAHGRQCMPVRLDVRDEEAVAALADRVYEEWGRCDLLVNNAALAPPKPALQDSTRHWRLGVDVNLNGPFYMIYYFAPRMLEAGEGRVINISSGVSQMPEFGRASYMTTKAALEAMTRALAFDLSGKVAVNCIQLEVPVWTEGFAATLPEDAPMQFEDAVIMSDALLWFADQSIDYTGKVLCIAELREMGVVRPFTPAKRG